MFRITITFVLLDSQYLLVCCFKNSHTQPMLIDEVMLQDETRFRVD
ncbi:hypothetical protein HanXRQr2_Chr05g0230821 [Helianthus annuus]|uniref:Uncharacterized protein n=1 Tax=Helianthus annuus TaxID=4232 RepID=A0A9K3J1J5_HELAN|nr:hypothetical protein HanXRQr2_Chr05g0230821 [Helianthus annuus]KAJ0585707.1 hypothetical protein HanHA89_Chr05g0203781 [Helianthus annuus]KAJ0923953.1 hypothetical protein HanPSC8_Chr05g0222651 [Helianthus annuus]